MDVDFELEIQHVVYLTIIGTLWLILTWFASDLFSEIYGIPAPSGISLFIKISWAIGGVIEGFAIFVFVETVLE